MKTALVISLVLLNLWLLMRPTVIIVMPEREIYEAARTIEDGLYRAIETMRETPPCNDCHALGGSK